jgi:hypothetical protein
LCRNSTHHPPPRFVDAPSQSKTLSQLLTSFSDFIGDEDLQPAASASCKLDFFKI